MNETVMPLAEHIQIVVSDRHTFGTDAVVLADFARIRRRDRALDMGTGCGLIPLLWLRDARQSPVACLDIQDRAVRQVQQSIALNHLEERLTVQQADLRDHRQLYPAGSFTLVSMNPPYKPVDTGILSPEPCPSGAERRYKMSVLRKLTDADSETFDMILRDEARARDLCASKMRARKLAM